MSKIWLPFEWANTARGIARSVQLPSQVFLPAPLKVHYCSYLSVASWSGDPDGANASGFESLAPILAELFSFEFRQKNETLTEKLTQKMTPGACLSFTLNVLGKCVGAKHLEIQFIRKVWGAKIGGFHQQRQIWPGKGLLPKADGDHYLLLPYLHHNQPTGKFQSFAEKRWQHQNVSEKSSITTLFHHNWGQHRLYCREIGWKPKQESTNVAQNVWVH